MLVVRQSAEAVSERLTSEKFGTCCVACINGPQSTVVSGEASDVHSLGDELQASGITARGLAMPFAFHSQQMDPILKDLGEFSQNVNLCSPKIPIASTLLGTLVEDRKDIPDDYIVRQTREPVQFEKALESSLLAGKADRDTVWLEIGPGKACVDMVHATLDIPRSKCLLNITKGEHDWMNVSASLARAHDHGISIRWRDYHNEYESALQLLELPSYAFDLKNHWIQYRGNWSITKNQESPPPQQDEPQGPISKFLHSVESEKIDGVNASATFLVDIADPFLNSLIRGHLVYGAGLCPSSVTANIAFKAASYITSKVRPSRSSQDLELSEFEIFKPIVAKQGVKSQVLKVRATTQADSDSIAIRFESEEGEHASCLFVLSSRKAWSNEWAKLSPLVRDRIEYLQQKTSDGHAHKIFGELVYQLFSTIVKYDKGYQSLEEIIMSRDGPEAAATFKLAPGTIEESSPYSPHLIDGISQLGGFALNSTAGDTVFLSNGWGNMRVSRILTEGKSYDCYVRMLPQKTAGHFEGDVYLLDGTEIVACCYGLKFRGVRRSVVPTLLGVGSATSHSQPVDSRSSKSKRKTSSESTSGVSIQESVLGVIAAEVGVPVGELADDAELADLGVDSILATAIISRLRQSTGLDLSSSIFSTYSTVGKLKAHLSTELQQKSTARSGSEESTAVPKLNVAQTASSQSRSASSDRGAGGIDIVESILSIIVEELGIDSGDLHTTDSFANLGLDSLMSISIIGTLKERLGINLSSSFFQENDTLPKIRSALGAPPKGDGHISSSSSASSPDDPDTPLSSSSSTTSLDPAQSLGKKYQAKAVHLQGQLSSTKPRALFLLPDGSGSSMSYVNLGLLETGLPVFALDSPFIKDPVQDPPHSFSTIAALYVAEIRRVQPSGPYRIGGWSLGGIFAYEVARLILLAGQDVETLFIVDSPCPGTLPPLPPTTVDLLEGSGLLSGLKKKAGKAVPESSKQHFQSMVRSLDIYAPPSLDQTNRDARGKVGSLRRALVLWARHGMYHGVPKERQAQIDVMAKEAGVNEAWDWMVHDRTDYSFRGRGWEHLLEHDGGASGKERMECVIVEGNHFLIMNPDQMRQVSRVIDDSVRGR